MQDKKVEKILTEDVEIPAEVLEKMQEAYERIGADTEKIVSADAYRRKTGNAAFKRNRRYLKAAVIMLCFLFAAATTSAATGFGFHSLSKLFEGDTELIEQSSAQPDMLVTKNTFDNMVVQVEEATGTDELIYLILNVKRTDGKKFEKGKVYNFGTISLLGEHDIDNSENRVNVDLEMEQNTYSNNGVMIENEGTDELRIALTYSYVREEGEEKYYLRGEKCTMSIMNLWEVRPDCSYLDQVDAEPVMRGALEMEFILDYGRAAVKTYRPDVNVEFPDITDDSVYYPQGRLTEMTLTPYYIRFVLDRPEEMGEYCTRRQVYLEMDDGTIVGCKTQKEEEKGKDRMGAIYGGKYDEETGLWSVEEYLLWSKLIDIDRVKAVHFGKNRIEL